MSLSAYAMAMASAAFAVGLICLLLHAYLYCAVDKLIKDFKEAGDLALECAKILAGNDVAQGD